MPTSPPAAAPAHATAPRRVLGTFDAGCVVIGAIVGVGIFFNPSGVAAQAGSAQLAMLAWAIAGLIALCGSLTFAELGAKYHDAGAQYQILRDAYGPMPAFLFVFCNATAIQAGAIGVIAVVCANNLAFVVGRPPPQGFAQLGLAAALIGLVTLANIVGVRWGSRVQNLTVLCKVLTLLVITLLAMLVPARPETLAPAAPAPTGGVGGVLAALVPALFAFGGWQHALWISGEVKEPRRTLPRAIVGGVLIVIFIYLLANWAYLHLLGYEGVVASKALAADAVGSVYPRLGARLIAGAVAISAFGVLNAQLLSGPRLVQSMAADGRFFAPFASLHRRFATPVMAILLLSGMALVLLAIAGDKGVDRLITGAVFIDSVFFVLTGAALIVLRRGSTDRSTPGFRAPLFPLFPVVFIIGELGVLVGAYVPREARAAALVGVAWIIGAAVLYLVCFRKRAAKP